jgi:hypothetical protein
MLLNNPSYYYSFLPNLEKKRMFQHHKIENKDTKSYMERCIKRLKNIDCDNTVAFISISDKPIFNHRTYTIQDFEEIINLLPINIKYLVVLLFGNTTVYESTTKIKFYSFPKNIINDAYIPEKYSLKLKNIFEKYSSIEEENI